MNYHFLRLWLLCGVLAIAASFPRIEAHRRWFPVWCLALLLAGPLVLFLVFVPREVLKRKAARLTEWMDN